MKKNNSVLVMCFFISVMGVNAQTLYDANRMMRQDLNGTSRFVGMGGAMGALGGDISTMGVNPAGIGIYRSNDIMLSFGFNRSNSESKYPGNVMKDGRTTGSFDNAGFVYSNKIGNKTALRYVNFGFNYHKIKSFNKRMVMGGEYDAIGVSQTSQMALQANGLEPSAFNNNNRPWEKYDIGWLSILGYKSALINPTKDDETLYSGFPSLTNPYGDFWSTESGGINAYDFNMSFNVEDRFYFGFTLGAYDVDYSRHTFYREGFDYTPETGDRSFYTKEDWQGTSGAGVDFKIGAIIRPIANSPLRIGLAVHTPTLYNLTDVVRSIVMSDLDLNLDGKVTKDEQFIVDTRDANGGDIIDYTIVTPWKYNVSLGYTIGSNLALGAEYEYSNYSTAKIKDYDGALMGEGDGVFTKSFMKGVHTFRVGAEFKPISQFAVRVGYNHITPSITNDSYKVIPYEGPNSVRTDTEYANTKSMNNYTVGMGYRGRIFYADIAYQLMSYKEDFYPFDNIDLAATKMKNDRHQLMMTLGVRF